MTTTRIIGIDLAEDAAHKAVVLDKANAQYVSDLLTFHTDPADLEQLLATAKADAPDDVRLIAVLEATGMAWYTVGSYLDQHGVEVYRVKGQQVGDLRRFYQKHVKSDRVDARVLARLPLLLQERLYRCFFPSGAQMSLQRACREVARLKKEIAASKNRIQATDRFAWLGLKDVCAPFSSEALWFREHYYNPWQVRAAGLRALTQEWLAASDQERPPVAWLTRLVAQAERVIAFYSLSHHCPDYELLQADLTREQKRISTAEEAVTCLRRETIRPLYRQLHPHRYLETIQGVGEYSAAVYVAFIGDITRFPSLKKFRSWSGMIPFSSQSGTSHAKGLRITKAGPDLLKATAFLNAQVARLWDPQIAAIYYKQMVELGKHYLQAICACATHLLDRVYVVLKEDRPYELRDVDGTPLDSATARQICRERYQVPDHIRRRNNYRVRRARREKRLEEHVRQ